MTTKPLLLDLFCGAGGAAVGYHRAGFDVVGVDIKPQPRYPFTFIKMDALDFARRWGAGVDVIHASPPCQAYSITANMHNNTHPELVEPTRAILSSLGKPYIIENVPGAPLNNPLVLCGRMFLGLRVYRHRLFETSFHVPKLAHIAHDDNLRENNEISRRGYCSPVGNFAFFDYAQKAMGIDWMSRKEISQAIPPVYTQWIGAHWLKANGYPYTLPEVDAPVQLRLAI